ncbi:MULTISPECIES: OmpA family protein [unclassified Herbaspirillum]|uniref:OmpA family protein n=1 Tax=unclassified Herbaspirillum TaxID=2624150 RepID=UPI000C09B196|nr:MULTISPECIES: OmpA family protein [unclassified Herbaspirillum]MAF02905.1 cell envelope biogenesis protein OmpA [Herbaspirillum sp.]MBO18613.1 cell envelope biogenesis protein OmpA [Herbaspirillum sp.]
MTLTLRRKTLVVRTLVAAIGASFVSGCAVDPATGKPSFKETFASDDPCSQNARNIGIGVGVLAGALLGRQVGGDNKGLLVGAALGGVIGGLIGNDMDKRRCELSKIAKQYQLDLQITALDNKGEAITTTDSAKAKQETAGSVVEIRDPAGAGGHFESNSDQLTARARDYFTAIAATYDIRKSAAEIQDPNLRKQYLEKMSQRKLLLVGHTDDTGSSRLNADLSERRARAVSRFMQEHGVPAASLYFQGAGEFYPIASNDTEDGRSSNRRVEIVELSDKASFDNYLAARRPRVEFYRQEKSDAPTVAQSGASTGVTAAAATQGVPRTRAATSAKNNTARTTRSADVVAKDNRNDGKGDAVATAPAPKTSASAPAANAPASASTRKAALPDSGDWIDFGGTPLIASSDTAAIGKVEGKRPFFSLISPAYADEPPVLADCTRDRPRAANGVKSLADGKAYRTSEHIPGLYGKTWTEQVNGHQVVINRIAVLAGDGTLANLPEFKVYKNYDAARRTSAKADVQLQPEVNTYLGSKGLLYRIFLKGQGGMQCADIVFDAGGGSAARAGRLVYLRANTPYAADFKPRMYQ